MSELELPSDTNLVETLRNLESKTFYNKLKKLILNHKDESDGHTYQNLEKMLLKSTNLDISEIVINMKEFRMIMPLHLVVKTTQSVTTLEDED